MNRCTFSPPTLLPALAVALFIAFPAGAQVLSASGSQADATVSAQSADNVKANIRQFPKTAVRGELVVYAAPEITMDSKPDRLAPGVRIRDANNQLVLSGALSKQTLVVNYVRDNVGLVHQVWILNAEEAKQKKPGEQDNGILTNIRTMFDTPTAVDDGKTPYHKLPGYKP